MGHDLHVLQLVTGSDESFVIPRDIPEYWMIHRANGANNHGVVGRQQAFVELKFGNGLSAV